MLIWLNAGGLSAVVDRIRDRTFAPIPLQSFTSLSPEGWLGSRVVSVLDSNAEGSGFKSQPRRCRVTVLGTLFTPIAPLFAKQRNW